MIYLSSVLKMLKQRTMHAETSSSLRMRMRRGVKQALASPPQATVHSSS